MNLKFKKSNFIIKTLIIVIFIYFLGTNTFLNTLFSDNPFYSKVHAYTKEGIVKTEGNFKGYIVTEKGGRHKLWKLPSLFSKEKTNSFNKRSKFFKGKHSSQKSFTPKSYDISVFFNENAELHKKKEVLLGIQKEFELENMNEAIKILEEAKGGIEIKPKEKEKIQNRLSCGFSENDTTFSKPTTNLCSSGVLASQIMKDKDNQEYIRSCKNPENEIKINCSVNYCLSNNPYNTNEKIGKACNGEIKIGWKIGGGIVYSLNSENLIIQSQDNNPKSWKDAKKFCKQYSKGGRKDRFLPSKSQLKKLHKKKEKIEDISLTRYWSNQKDSENSINAWRFSIPLGKATNYIKKHKHSFRCVRKF